MRTMTTHKTVVAAVAVLAALALPMMAGAADKLIVEDGTIRVKSGVDSKVVITEAGQIGIGVAAPTRPLHLVTKGLSNVTSGFIFQHTATGDLTTGETQPASAPNVTFYRSNDPITAPSDPMEYGDILGVFNFGTVVNGSFKTSALIASTADSNWSSTQYPTFLRFATSGTVNGAYKTLNEVMRLTSTGNVGIGLTTPTQKLEVNGGLRLKPAVAKPLCDANARGTFWFTSDGTNQNDSVEICAYKTGVLGWQPLY